MTAVKVVFYLSVVIACLTVVNGSAINNIAPSEVNADYLIELGIKTNDVKLQAVGMAMNNIHRDPCSEWTKWSVCSANIFRHFGIKQRSRKCSNETEYNLCRNRCPLSYQTTKHGYCIKKKYTISKSQNDAQKECKKDGGYLVHIDSPLKYEDIITTGLSQLSPFIFIGGQRKNTHSPWLFEDGSKIKFFKWATSEPDNGSDELCLLIDRTKGHMHDWSCSGGSHFICEIPV